MKRFKRAEDILIGVVGYGGMGRSHLEQMQKAGMTPLCVVEPNPERLEQAVQDFPGIETYSSVSDMLKKSKASLLGILTPHSTHAKLALQCIRGGRHVITEKPFAVTTAECSRMIASAKKHKVMVTAYHNRHWDPWIMQVLKMIRKGDLGEVVRIEIHNGGRTPPHDVWRWSKKMSGGILYDWGVHLFEDILQIVDSDISEVTAFYKKGFWAKQSKYKEDCIEDEGYVVVRFASGIWATVCISSFGHRPKGRHIQIVGTQGILDLTAREWKLTRFNKRNEPIETKGENPPSEAWRFYKNIINHLTKGEKLVITPEWARRPIHILDLADRSARLGRAVKAKYK